LRIIVVSQIVVPYMTVRFVVMQAVIHVTSSSNAINVDSPSAAPACMSVRHVTAAKARTATNAGRWTHAQGATKRCVLFANSNMEVTSGVAISVKSGFVTNAETCAHARQDVEKHFAVSATLLVSVISARKLSVHHALVIWPSLALTVTWRGASIVQNSMVSSPIAVRNVTTSFATSATKYQRVNGAEKPAAGNVR